MTDTRKEKVVALAEKFRKAKHGDTTKWASAEDMHLAVVALNHFDETVEYEYAIKRSSVLKPHMEYIMGDYWGWKAEREASLGDYQKLGSPLIKYWLVRRRKAGPVEDA